MPTYSGGNGKLCINNHSDCYYIVMWLTDLMVEKVNGFGMVLEQLTFIMQG